MGWSSLTFDWISRDGKVIILARGIRSFAQGFVSVFLAIYLTKLGFTLVQVLLKVAPPGPALVHVQTWLSLAC